MNDEFEAILSEIISEQLDNYLYFRKNRIFTEFAENFNLYLRSIASVGNKLFKEQLSEI